LNRLEIGQCIRNLRKALGMTQLILGEKSGLATSTICDIEKGRCKPSIDSLERIAMALKVNPAFLLSSNYVNNVIVSDSNVTDQD